jgi:medium-chain acyl-[acyl-carrier-protein] hydrolase
LTFPPDIEVCAVEYPSRGTRANERHPGTVDALAREAAESISALIEKPFAVLGYSLGGVVAFESIRKLRAGRENLPTSLIVCAVSGPTSHSPSGIHELSDSALVARVQELFDGIPQPILREPELLKFLLPTLRADMKAFETYRFEEAAPLPCPIHAFGAERDRSLSRDAIESWARHTCKGFSLTMFQANHIFLASHARELGDSVVRLVRSPTVGNSPGPGTPPRNVPE